PSPDLVIGDPSAVDELTTNPDTSSAIGPGKNGRRGTEQGIFGPRPGPRGPGNRKKGEKPPLTPLDGVVLNGLRWLARHQNADGSWSAATLADHCLPGDPCGDPKQSYTHNYDEGLTGMAMLAYLGAGFTHESREWLLDKTTNQRWKIGD